MRCFQTPLDPLPFHAASHDHACSVCLQLQQPAGMNYLTRCILRLKLEPARRYRDLICHCYIKWPRSHDAGKSAHQSTTVTDLDHERPQQGLYLLRRGVITPFKDGEALGASFGTFIAQLLDCFSSLRSHTTVMSQLSLETESR